MGLIRELPSSPPMMLEPEHLVGRAPLSALRIGERYVSAQHAVLRWNGESWELKDLGSRNGTFIDGIRIAPGRHHAIRAGARMAFGKLERQWELVDAAPPSAMAVPLDGGDPVLLEDGLLAVPSTEDPRATIYRGADGEWVLEQVTESISPVANLQTFEVGGRTWRFCFPENLHTTAISKHPKLEVRHLQLTFSVSRDEEYVQLNCTSGAARFDLGTRAHNYLLLTLARRRIADAAEGLPETSCGWFYHEDLARLLGVGPPQLNNDVFRIRKQFVSIGVVDAPNIIERRPRTQQLRIGSGALNVIII
jgi:hypothetical protein